MSSPETLSPFLRSLDLSENETSVYLAALTLGNALVRDIAKRAGLNRTTTYTILLGLRKLGLVSSYQKNRLLHFSASAPQALEDMLTDRIAQQQKLKQQLQAFMPELRGLYRAQGKGSGVQLFEGLQSLPEIYRSLYRGARYPDEGLELTNWGGKYHLFPEAVRWELFQKFKKNNLWTRSLLIEDDMTRQWKQAEQGISMRKKIKLLPNPGWDWFANLEMCRDRIAIVTYTTDQDFQGLVIASHELSHMFRLMFEGLWAQV